MGDIFEDNMLLEDTTKKYTLAPYESIFFNITLPITEKIVDMPQGILKQNNLLGDSIRIVFNSTKFLLYIKDELGKDSLYLESSYEYSKINNFSVKFLYDFSEDDYNNATEIK